MRLWSGLVLLAGALSATAFVSNVDDTGNVRRWKLESLEADDIHTNVVNRSTGAIRYSLASDAFSTANTKAELNAVRAAFAQWQAVPGSRLKFEEGGLAAPGVAVAYDHTNVVFWAKQSTLINVDGHQEDIRGFPSVTYVYKYDDNNTIVEADIVLNAVEFNWQTEFQAGRDFPVNTLWVEATALHEIGHLLGLEHSPVGGATMLWQELGGVGVTPRAGLSSDETNAVCHLYPSANQPPRLGTLSGQVRLGATGAFGAAVFAEDAAGNVVAGTVTQTDGTYELPALPAGSYGVRVSPLDPASALQLQSLVRGKDIYDRYTNAMTSFLPTTNRVAVLAGGATSTVNFNLTGGEPPFRIFGILPPTANPEVRVVIRTPVSLGRGQSNVFVGVYGPSLPTNNVKLTISGDGVSVGETVAQRGPLDGLVLVRAPVAVATNATPGLRTFVVQQGTNLAYANGFLEIAPPFPDWNFDGLDDQFQRRYFPLFTAAEAGPEADPDGDGFSNRSECQAGTDPTNAHSFPFRITGLKPTSTGTTITFLSGLKDRFQVLSRPDLASGSWQPVGLPVQPTSTNSQYADPSATNGSRFYQVEALP